ncbi:hypothetical protein [Acaryochloris sp. IP29b_bin.148]|uniref:GumC family protein n=1 Tax=Acaryochloris sp. IP29b_bin.148 TaxID=2969218 RepID=UPI0026208762|nr:hypothetical protein [Acaryochloris sp. IP29b_bin.148]
MQDHSPYSPISPSAYQRTHPNISYRWLGIVLNGMVWSCVFLYLKLSPPIYSSQVGVIVVGGDSKIDVALPGGVRAATSPASGQSNSFEDPRTIYTHIATNPAVLDKAAQQLGMDSAEFGEPEITVDEESAILSFAIQGKTPLISQRKLYALFTAIDQRLQKLREFTLAQREGEKQLTLSAARRKEEKARSTLSKYQSASAYNSDQQLQELSTTIEQLRRVRSENYAKAKGLGGRLARLDREVELNTQTATDRYRLEGDPVYQKLLSEYGRLKAELTQISALLSPQHPQVQDVQEQLNAASSALQSQGSSALGKQLQTSALLQLTPLNADPQTSVVRGELFKDSVSGLADRDELIFQDRVLAKEIARMEARLNTLSGEKHKVDGLRRDLQVAETLLASTLTKLDRSRIEVYAMYPPIQMVTEPTLPDEDAPISPNKQMAFLTGLAGSFIVTLGLVLIWYEKRDPSPSLARLEQETLKNREELERLHS